MPVLLCTNINQTDSWLSHISIERFCVFSSRGWQCMTGRLRDNITKLLLAISKNSEELKASCHGAWLANKAKLSGAQRGGLCTVLRRK